MSGYKRKYFRKPDPVKGFLMRHWRDGLNMAKVDKFIRDYKFPDVFANEPVDNYIRDYVFEPVKPVKRVYRRKVATSYAMRSRKRWGSDGRLQKFRMNAQTVGDGVVKRSANDFERIGARLWSRSHLNSRASARNIQRVYRGFKGRRKARLASQDKVFGDARRRLALI